MPAKTKYPKRYNAAGRQLCYGDKNTCTNLAGYKETAPNGKRRYHNECDAHRRRNHGATRLRFKHRPSYIHLKKCRWCKNKAEHRHRIERQIGYKLGNVLTLCKSCHIKAHAK